MSLRRAVENSKNGCAYSLFNELTPKVGLSYVTDMNFTKIVPEDYTLSAALGGLTYGVTTVEMANAFSTLENHGEYRQTDCISSILDSDGNEIYEEPEVKRIYSTSAADQMTDILTGVLTSGTAKGLKWSSSSDIEAAGKTGTTNDNKVAWFCGYTPYYTIAVWVGYDQPKSVDGLWGQTYPAYIWKSAMLYMTDGLDEASFELDDSTESEKKEPVTVVTEPEETSAEEETTDPAQTEQPEETTDPDGTIPSDTTEPSDTTDATAPTDTTTDNPTDTTLPQETEGVSGGNINSSSTGQTTGGETGGQGSVDGGVTQ